MTMTREQAMEAVLWLLIAAVDQGALPEGEAVIDGQHASLREMAQRALDWNRAIN